MAKLIELDKVLEILHASSLEDSHYREIKRDIEYLPTTEMDYVMDWIPVSERLPDRNGRYMAYCKGCNAVGEMFYKSRSRAFFIGEASRYPHGEISHWQPLPEPPK